MGYTSVYPVAYNTDTVKATTYFNFGTAYVPWNAPNPAKSLVGDQDENTWIATTNASQRFHIDLGSANTIQRIYYENYHSTGTGTTRGIENFTFWGSNDAGAFAELTYATDTNWTQITTASGALDQHVAANTIDPKYMLVTNSTAYRYYALKISDNWGASDYVGLRRIELQVSDGEATDELRRRRGH